MRVVTSVATVCGLAFAIACTWPGVASAQIYRCDNGNGVVEYSNSPASGRDTRCRAVDLPSITTIPAPKPPPQPAGRAPGSSATATPAGFPKVDASAQRTRDLDRRKILEDELRKEEARLGELRAEFNGGEPERRGDERNYQKYLERVQRLKDDIARSESSVASLKREMASLRE
ncbi:MAG: DUF4124 domain-containing protein [Burkholderiaceae bacterium]|jgi:hypothetical protein